MGNLVVLQTGVGINTSSGNQTQIESDIVIGDVDTANPLQGLKVNLDGATTIDIQLAVFVNTFAKFSNLIAGTVIGLITRIATGRLFAKSGVITFTNAGATTPQVMWNSQRTGGRPILASQQLVNPSSVTVFSGDDFAGIFFTTVANISSFDVTFSDGTQQSMTVIEADALFAKTCETEANGRLDAAVTGFDNRRGNIGQVRLTTTAGAGGVPVMLVK